MATICDFGTAPEQAKAGYKMVGVVTGSDEELLEKYAGMNVRFVRGAAIHGQPGQWEFAAMHPLESVPVKHWETYEGDEAPALHQIDVQDMRATSGQVYVTAGSIDGKTEDMISAVAEINTSPANGVDHVPCLHVSFDTDALAFSAFKVGDRILLRLEEGVSLTRVDTPEGPMYAVD
ncbi:hypothetical protein Q1Z72_01410 [Pseudomonas qingdaonensis]|uniref:hypothetical protein n=1 Tax=Pseudomonas TaxID=286 RepID=UPI00211982AB|nr:MULTISPECIES: hypothetical protein [Pseudomonas]UXH55944.1 hypothetical protein N5876_32880 [Pseudomonas aeruginosa]UXH68988.1 hypothetical protein N5879_32320 [Pseudomonas aeruginosa]WKL67352.1 hypothetical protein Q1Z72_01410 [Pseudomonas qingdaonensis]